MAPASIPRAHPHATPRQAPIALIGPFTPGPDDLIRIQQLLDDEASRDDGPSESMRRERDRALGRRLGDAGGDAPLALVMAWCDERERDAGHHAAPFAMSVVTGAVVLIGLLLGALAASGAFFYDGTARVNVLLLIGLFVALPAATLVLFALACVLGHGQGIFNPGRLGALIGRALPSERARALARLAAGSRGPDVARWIVLTWSQWLALGFGAGAVSAALVLVVFTDLAFGWSTTLDVEAATVQRVVEALALPWRDLVPAAVPSGELIESSRYFRLAVDVPVEEPQRLGRWWPFVAMAMLVYGTAPRVLTTPLAGWRLSRACRRSLLADPAVQALLRRMTTPMVETRSADPETRAAAGPDGMRLRDLPRVDAWQVVNWAAVPVEQEPVARLLQPARLLAIHPAGGSRSTAQDRELAHALAGTPADSGILVIARGFDPPTLDLMDFLHEVRRSVPAAVPVAIAPVAVSDGAPAALAQRHADVWASALARDAGADIEAVTLTAGVPA